MVPAGGTFQTTVLLEDAIHLEFKQMLILSLSLFNNLFQALDKNWCAMVLCSNPPVAIFIQGPA